MSKSLPNVSRSRAAGQSNHQARYLPWLLGGVIATAAGVRIWAACDEFWQDEIWSVMNIVRARLRFGDILTLHHDNNHYLISFWICLVGPQYKNWIVYRIPSLVAGVGTVLLAALAARRWGPAAVTAATLLTGSSFVLILYASEARGYALAGFFGLMAFLALDRYFAKPSTGVAIGFGLSTILGTLGHLTCVQFYVGALAWSAVAVRRRARTRGEFVRHMAKLHLLPLVGLAALYWLDVRAMRVGGGDVRGTLDMIGSAASLAVGSFAVRPWPTALFGLTAVLLAIVGLGQLQREKSDLWVFFAVTIFAAPALMLAILRPPLVYERYFYIQIVFVLLLASYVFARLVAAGGSFRVIAIAGLAAMVAGNIALDAELLCLGRGHYLDALRYMAEHSPNHVIYLAGDDDFDNQHYLAFYFKYVPKEWKATLTNYRALASGSVDPSQWLMLHSQQRPYSPPEGIRTDGTGIDYRLMRVFPCSRLSGYQFALYERSPRREQQAAQD